MTGALEVRDLTGDAEWSAASALYRSVFGYRDPDHAVSPRLLAALRANAGSVLGAFDPPGTLIGFCYGFTAVEAGELYHYSQAAVVDPRAQGRGVGRLLKHAQADTARATGARSMRWAFDPYALRNAHFNFAVLGAAGIRFLPDYYGTGDSDRVLVRWDLTDQQVPPPGVRSEVVAAADDREAAGGPGERETLRRDLIAQFDAGGRLVSVDRHPAGAVYVFEREQP